MPTGTAIRICFNSRPRAAGDNFLVRAPARVGRFNSRPRAAGDRLARAGTRRTHVSTHARAQRATDAVDKQMRGVGFQLTPARSGRPKPVLCANRDGVSTHARAQRATRPGADTLGRCNVSTHARAQRATSDPMRLVAMSSFQLTPARSGRLPGNDGNAGRLGFNSRPRAAGDANNRIAAMSPPSFNSRPRAAGDHRSTLGMRAHRVSTHARAQRATAATSSD